MSAGQVTLREGAGGAPSGRAAEARSGAATTRPRARVTLFGLFGCGNLGNDGSLEAAVDWLRSAAPEIDLRCVCTDPDVVGSSFAVEALPIRSGRRWPRPLRLLNRAALRIPTHLADVARAYGVARRSDLLLVPGTGILDDFGERPSGMPLDLVKWFLAARLAGTRVALVSVGAGPIRNPASRRLMAAAARLAGYRSYRDHGSCRFMATLGVDGANDAVFPDIVFQLDAPAAAREVGAERPLTVGLGVMTYYGWYRFGPGGEEIFRTYIGKLDRFVRHLLAAGHRVRLLTGELGDRTAIAALMDRLSDLAPDALGRVTPVYSRSLTELMAAIGETDLVVATRYHNVVCALKMGRPAISLGYAEKNDLLMASVGLGAFCHHVETFDVGRLIADFDAVTGDLGALAAGVSRATLAFEARLRQQSERLLDALS